MPGQESVIDFLEKHPDRSFTKKELEENLGVVGLNYALRILRENEEVNYERKKEYPFAFLYRYKPGKGVSIKQLSWKRKNKS